MNPPGRVQPPIFGRLPKSHVVFGHKVGSGKVPDDAWARLKKAVCDKEHGKLLLIGLLSHLTTCRCPCGRWRGKAMWGKVSGTRRCSRDTLEDRKMSKHFEKQIVKPGTLVVNLSIRRHRDLNLYFRKTFQKILKEVKKDSKGHRPLWFSTKKF